MPYSRRDTLVVGGMLAASGFAKPAIAKGRKELIMVTSWPANSPGPAASAKQFAERVERGTDGHVSIKIFSSGELVPPFAVFDAVVNGSADFAHTASFFWQGKIPASVFFTTVPFGLEPLEHNAWLHHGGGLELWQEIYKPFGIVPLSCGNTGSSMGGWFREPVSSLDDMVGLKYRMPGIGGLIVKELGATPVEVPPAEIYTSLASGTIDAAEFLGPWSDMGFGFFKQAPYYAYPGFHEPNGSSELLIGEQTWQECTEEQRLCIKEAAHLADAESLQTVGWNNAQALKVLQAKHKVTLFAFPDKMLRAARAITKDVLSELAAKDNDFAKVRASYDKALDVYSPWAEVSSRSFLDAR